MRSPAGRGFSPMPLAALALCFSTYADCFRARAAEILRLTKRPMTPTATTKTMAKTTTTPASFWAQFSRLAMWEMVSREIRALLMAGILAVIASEGGNWESIVSSVFSWVSCVARRRGILRKAYREIGQDES